MRRMSKQVRRFLSGVPPMRYVFYWNRFRRELGEEVRRFVSSSLFPGAAGISLRSTLVWKGKGAQDRARIPGCCVSSLTLLAKVLKIALQCKMTKWQMQMEEGRRSGWTSSLGTGGRIARGRATHEEDAQDRVAVSRVLCNPSHAYGKGAQDRFAS